MLIDTHAHINMMVKKEFDIPLDPALFPQVQAIIDQSATKDVKLFINVGTSIVESENCIRLAQEFKSIYAAIGVHPNDATDTWRADIKQLATWAREKNQNKIVAIGECGLDMHYPEYNLQRQKDVFKAQIELSLEHNLALIVHTRDAYDETLRILEEFKGHVTRGIIHCFSEDISFAKTVIDWGHCIGIGGAITYPKNQQLRDVVIATDLQHIVLETDAPFLPIQSMRGKQNSPMHINDIAHYIAQLKEVAYDDVAEHTTRNALSIFRIEQ